MFVANLADTAVWQPLLTHPVIRESLSWLREHADTAEFGIHPLDAPDWYVNVHGYDTLSDVDCRWENHLHTIDIQYLVRGSEGIRWTNVQKLGGPDCYVEKEDRQEFERSSGNGSLLLMRPGMFAIFLPGEAHCPKIALREPVSLHKVVVKIPAGLLGLTDE